MSDPLIELLRRHDPARGSAGPPPVERVLARIDAREPGQRLRRRAPRRPIAAAVALLCLAALAVGVLVGRGGDRDDALAPAARGDVIVHVVTRTSMEVKGRRTGATMQAGQGRSVGTMDGPIERWRTTAPARWRSVMTLLPQRGMPGGTVEQTYADGVERTRASWRRGVQSQRVPRTVADGGLFGVMTFGSPGRNATRLIAGVADPRGAVQAMRDRGEVRAAGETTRDGRRLLRFVGETPMRRTGRRSVQLATRTLYLLDAETYAPVEVAVAQALGRHPRDFGSATLIEFDVYETIPLDASTEHLLRLGGR